MFPSKMPFLNLMTLTFVVVFFFFFAVFLFNELSGPRMSSADFGVVEILKRRSK